MQIYLPNVDIDIQFQYWDHSENYRPVGERAWAYAETECIIYDGFTEKEVSGSAYCSISDEYNRETGETIALDRALGNLTLAPNIADFVWAEYRNAVAWEKENGTY